jgi:hypothetical protein
VLDYFVVWLGIVYFTLADRYEANQNLFLKKALEKFYVAKFKLFGREVIARLLKVVRI